MSTDEDAVKEKPSVWARWCDVGQDCGIGIGGSVIAGSLCHLGPWGLVAGLALAFVGGGAVKCAIKGEFSLANFLKGGLAGVLGTISAGIGAKLATKFLPGLVKVGKEGTKLVKLFKASGTGWFGNALLLGTQNSIFSMGYGLGNDLINGNEVTPGGILLNGSIGFATGGLWGAAFKAPGLKGFMEYEKRTLPGYLHYPMASGIPQTTCVNAALYGTTSFPIIHFLGS